MKSFNTKKMVLSALFAALCCVATMSIQIPTPGTGGYVHPGDAVVILCGAFLSPGAAFLAAGIGSCMADLLGGYFIYAPITFVIKGAVAYLAGRVFADMGRQKNSPYIALAFSGVIDMIVVAGGYCLCESILYGFPAAIASVPANLIQGFSGLLISGALYPMLRMPVKKLGQNMV